MTKDDRSVGKTIVIIVISKYERLYILSQINRKSKRSGGGVERQPLLVDTNEYRPRSEIKAE
jgi:hypothetical protein